MTKEEIFDKYSHVDTNELGNLCGADYMDSNDFYKAADEWAEQESIAFLKWVKENNWVPNSSGLWFNSVAHRSDLLFHTDEELYRLFKTNAHE